MAAIGVRYVSQADHSHARFLLGRYFGGMGGVIAVDLVGKEANMLESLWRCKNGGCDPATAGLPFNSRFGRQVLGRLLPGI